MKRKVIAVLSACVAACSLAAFAGCANGKPEGGGDGAGTLTIPDVKVYVLKNRACTFAELEPVFSNPDKKEPLTYRYDENSIKIENGIVTPTTTVSQNVSVRAKSASENFNVTFTVEIERLDLSDSIYDTTRFSSSIASRTETCKSVTAETTLFIGDSFMDDYFIGEYMQTYAQDKKVLNAGINSTTSYHWEAAYSDIIGTVAPKNIVMHIGTNNFYDAPHGSVQDCEESLQRLFMFMHSSYPTSNIYWFNITQRVDSSYAQRVTQTNADMSQWCAKYDWITCVDTCSKVTADMLRTDDGGVHPKTETYRVFTDALVNAGCEIVNK